MVFINQSFVSQARPRVARAPEELDQRSQAQDRGEDRQWATELKGCEEG
jgi:hypothetical protein